MTYQGMRSDSVSRTQQSYILIPHSGNRLPERIEPPHALRLVQNNLDQDDQALHRVFDRIQDNQELVDCVRGLTTEGLLIYGTMADAFALSNIAEMKEPTTVEAEEVPVSNVTFLGKISSKFSGSVAHYTGHIRHEAGSIRSAFGGLAEAANKPRFGNEPKLALAA